MSRKQMLVLLAVIVGSGVVFLDSTVVNLALPSMAKSLGFDFAGQQWMINGYLLTLSALMLLGGSLGDIYGYKKIYVIGLVGFGLTSVLCMYPNTQWIIVMRILHGVFGALLIPGSLALININFSLPKRGRAFGLWTAATAAVTALGPLIGGLLVDNFGWQWVFVLPLPFLLLSLILMLTSVKDNAKTSKRQVDYTGALLAMLGLGGITYGLIQGPVGKWGVIPVLSLVFGAITFVLFLLYESRIKQPMLNLSLFKSANFTAANISTFALYGALGGLSFVLLIYLQETLGYSSLAAGAVLLPIVVLLVLLSSRFGALSSRFGPKWFMTVGPLLVALGVGWLFPLKSGSSFWLGLLPGLILFGFGMAMTVAPLTTTVMTSITEKDSGIASAVNNAVSRVAGLIIIAVLGVFGTAHLYQNTVILCAVLASLAGLVSFLLVRNKRTVAKV
jgi:EmrB/QacA subfamily drug resistance transporter